MKMIQIQTWYCLTLYLEGTLLNTDPISISNLCFALLVLHNSKLYGQHSMNMFVQQKHSSIYIIALKHREYNNDWKHLIRPAKDVNVPQIQNHQLQCISNISSEVLKVIGIQISNKSTKEEEISAGAHEGSRRRNTPLSPPSTPAQICWCMCWEREKT